MILRHDRGKIGWDAEVCAATRLDAASRVYGDSMIWESDLRNARVIDTDIYLSRLIDTVAANKRIVAADIINSVIWGNAIVIGTRSRRAIIEDCRITDAVVVFGPVEIRGINLSRMMRLDSGVWERPPGYFEVANDHTVFGVTESTGGYCFVGCQKFSIESLLRGKARFQKVIGFSDKTIDDMVRRLTEWRD